MLILLVAAGCASQKPMAVQRASLVSVIAQPMAAFKFNYEANDMSNWGTNVEFDVFSSTDLMTWTLYATYPGDSMSFSVPTVGDRMFFAARARSLVTGLTSQFLNTQ